MNSINRVIIEVMIETWSAFNFYILVLKVSKREWRVAWTDNESFNVASDVIVPIEIEIIYHDNVIEEVRKKIV